MNSSEMFNREKKAAALAACLLKHNITAEDIANASPEDWELAAEAASEMVGRKVHPPHSQATIDLVLQMMQKEVMPETEVRTVQPEGGFGSPFENYTPAQQEADEAAAAEQKAEDKWEESQEYAGNRCPPRE